MTEQELINEIKLVGQAAIGAYEKGNTADFCRLSEEQKQLKLQLERLEISKMDFKDLIEVNW